MLAINHICLTVFPMIYFVLVVRGQVNNNATVTCDFRNDEKEMYEMRGVCPPRCFRCLDGSGCLYEMEYCDSNVQCLDGSDEVTSLRNENDGIVCSNYFTNASCVLPHSYTCDRTLVCGYGEDECGCMGSNRAYECRSPPDSSLNVSMQCIPRRQFCDNIPNCDDGSDEAPFSSNSSTGFRCRSTKTGFTFGCLLPNSYVCDNFTDCDDAIDECFCDEDNLRVDDSYWNGRCFRCIDGSMVIPNKQLCNGRLNCQDLSDECLCPLNRPTICQQICLIGEDCGQCKVGQIKCKEDNDGLSKCINRTQVCDQHYDCPFYEDEQVCDVDFSQMFTCDDQSMYIPQFRQCDNNSDCPDSSDEANCTQLFYECQVTDNDDFAIPIYAVACDRIPTCGTLDDECNSSLCNGSLPGYCDFVDIVEKRGFRCPNTRSEFIGREVCDGFPTCNETHPHVSADELFCQGFRFYCKDMGENGLPIHIPMTSQCDGVSDCLDESDEMNCSNTTHFYCNENTVPFYITREKVCDDNQDCQNGEDECYFCSNNAFSSDDFLISSYVLQVLIWIVGITAVIGNTVVLWHNGWKLWKKGQSLSEVSYHHRILVINVALADLLLGIYLIILGSANNRFQGTYCQNDIQWRASASCIVIGCIAMISVECSVFLLVTMATFRLLLIMRPFTSRNKFLRVSVILSWGVACLLAFIPLSPTLTDYFVSQVWYRNIPFFSLVKRNKMESFATSMLSLNGTLEEQSQNVLTWDMMIDVVSRINSTSFVPELYFGFYSADGVCLPRIFPDPTEDRAYGYALFLILINFFAFIYMALAYIFIYRITVKRHKEAGQIDKTNVVLQRKISRVILSNGCCWIPICIMSFITASGVQLTSTAYAVSAIVLLPINSAFNPFLYSDIPELIWKKCFSETKCGEWTKKKFFITTASASMRRRAGSSAYDRQGRRSTSSTVISRM